MNLENKKKVLYILYLYEYLPNNIVCDGNNNNSMKIFYQKLENNINSIKLHLSVLYLNIFFEKCRICVILTQIFNNYNILIKTQLLWSR